MVNVWASCGVESTSTSHGPWKAFAVPGLKEIISNLEALGLRNNVDRLAIVAHGDIEGNVQMSPPLTHNTIGAFSQNLRAIRNYLKPGAPLMFLACQCAGGANGDRLLQGISSIVAGNPVIGFTCANQIAPGPAGYFKVFAPMPDPKVDRNDEWSPWAKWSTYGMISRQPLYELVTFQSKDPTGRKRCGSNVCPGHSKFGDQCSPYKRATWPSWVPR